MIGGALAAIALLAGGADDLAKLGWLVGSWRESTVSTTTQETWTAPVGGVMSGVTETRRGGKTSLERTRISVEPAGVTFTAELPGQPPTAFVLVKSGDGEAVFENKAHDFPQRVIYRRCGAQLCARIEGKVGGELRSRNWVYTRAD